MGNRSHHSLLWMFYGERASAVVHGVRHALHKKQLNVLIFHVEVFNEQKS